jgi:2-polyprenyl-6-methoxyphenol hydroxylase-like FAD-dependent oxidoreductase
MRTQVAINGSGPAGLLLSHLLGLEGIESVLVERQSAGYVQARIRGFPILTSRWTALQHTTLAPSRIGDIVKSAVTVTHFEHKMIK